MPATKTSPKAQAQAPDKPEPKIQIEELSPILRRVSVEVDSDTVAEAIARAYVDLSHAVKVKGFRPGKAPRRVLERQYKAEVERDVIAHLVSQSYSRVVSEQDLWPVAEPVIENDKLAEGEPFRYRAQVEVKPKLDPKDYVGIPLKDRKAEVTDDELAEELIKVRDSMATLEPIEDRTLGVAGDWALVDYTLAVDGKPVTALERNTDQPVELTDGTIVKGHIPELRGVTVGSSVDVTFPFPADYKIAEMQGKTGVFHVTLKGLRRRNVPALDDELVKDLDDPELTTLAQLRERIRERTLAARREEAERETRHDLEVALVQRNPFEAPPALVGRVAEGELRMLAAQIQRAGLNPRDLNIDPEKMRSGTEQRVKAELLLEAIAEKEKLEVTDEDLDAHYEKLAAENEVPVARVKAQLGRAGSVDALKRRMLEDKALAFVRSKATIEG